MPLIPRNPYDANGVFGSTSQSSNLRIILGVVCAALVVLFGLVIVWRRRHLPLPTADHRLRHLGGPQGRRRPATKKQVVALEEVEKAFPKRKLEPWQLEVSGDKAKFISTDLEEEKDLGTAPQDLDTADKNDLKRTTSLAPSQHSASTDDAEAKSTSEIESGDDSHFLLTCPICLDEFSLESEVRVLSCGHTFHAACLDPWLTNRSYCCPSCRKPALELKDTTAEKDGAATQPVADSRPEPIQAPIVAPRAPQPSFQRSRFFRFAHRSSPQTQQSEV